MYSIKITNNNLLKPTAFVKTKGENVIIIELTDFMVDDLKLAELKLVADAYNQVCDTKYPDNANAADVKRIDDIVYGAFERMNELARDIARTSRKS